MCKAEPGSERELVLEEVAMKYTIIMFFLKDHACDEHPKEFLKAIIMSLIDPASSLDEIEKILLFIKENLQLKARSNPSQEVSMSDIDEYEHGVFRQYVNDFILREDGIPQAPTFTTNDT